MALRFAYDRHMEYDTHYGYDSPGSVIPSKANPTPHLTRLRLLYDAHNVYDAHVGYDEGYPTSRASAVLHGTSRLSGDQTPLSDMGLQYDADAPFDAPYIQYDGSYI